MKEKKKINKLPVSTCVIFMTISVAILSVAVPLIQSELTKIQFDVIESQGHLNQSEIKNLEVEYYTHFANYLFALSTSSFKTNKDWGVIYQTSRDQADTNLRYRIALLYIMLNNKYPNKELLDKWKVMNFEQLQEVSKKPSFKEYDWRKSARKKIFWFNFSKWILNLLALILYTIGLLGLNFKKSISTE
ncbi:MAG TPA: hypothetical protein DCE80_10815 [Ignavibacteriales bacterium]|nr:hypothetical protein [Ignavibacteriales bacterium]